MVVIHETGKNEDGRPKKNEHDKQNQHNAGVVIV
jgi:hypothetical protein